MCMTAPSSGGIALAYSNSILFTYSLAEIKSIMNVRSNSSADQTAVAIHKHHVSLIKNTWRVL
jgi:hypothetical protein